MAVNDMDGRGSMTVQLDQKYYDVVPPKSAAERFMISARKNIFQDFMLRMRPSASDSIVDVGVSDVVNDTANVLERMYPYPANITACGLGDGVEFQNTFREVRYVRIEPNVALPFDNARFDVATSNAVLEHVGTRENQTLFVTELCRVARRVFISVPNRFFPIEHHTAIPFAHWQDHLFRAACRASRKSEWAQEQNLILMSRKHLWRLAAEVGRSAAVGYTGLHWGPFSSNLYLAFH